LVAEYRAASDKRSRSVAALQAETVRLVLAGTIEDELDASRRLGYELRREHVALLAWRRRGFPLDTMALSSAAVAAAAVLRAADPLVVSAGTGEVWVWCPRLDASPSDIHAALDAVSIDAGVGLAVGRRAVGIAGFRRTHTEAVAAARVASLAGERAGSVTSYHAVELVALLTADLGSARAFVRNELGALGAAGRQAQTLRETVLAFVEEGMSNRRAARRLFCHQNTVAYRMARVPALLGRPLEVRRAELIAALILTRTLGTSVLEADDDVSS
jgi:DNA-binding PucR family transcriptional regulator